LVGGFVLPMLMAVWMLRGVSRTGDAAYERQDAYFIPRMRIAEMGPPNSVWAGGSVVRKAIDGYAIEVTYGVQPLVPHERGVPTSWDVLVPRFTVTAAKPRRPLDRVDAYWSSDSEVLGATGPCGGQGANGRPVFRRTYPTADAARRRARPRGPDDGRIEHLVREGSSRGRRSANASRTG
jgi:hypothetical protein